MTDAIRLELIRRELRAAKDRVRASQGSEDVIFEGVRVARVWADVLIRDEDDDEKREEVSVFVKLTHAGREIIPLGWNRRAC